MHIIGEIARQPDHGVGDILRLADATVGNQLKQLFPRVALRILFIDGGGNGARRDAVHANALFAHFLRQRAHQQIHATLGGRIVGVSGPRNQLMHRTHVNNFPHRAADVRTGTLAAKLAQCRTGAEKLPGQINIQHAVPLLQRHIGKRSIFLQAGVGHQNVQRAKTIHRMFDEIIHIRFF